MAGDLAGRHILVTGGNSGIGRAAVQALVARGAAVTVASRSEEKTRPVLEGIRAASPGAQLEFLALDLGRLGSVRDAAQRFLDSGKPLDVLVNNAGIAGSPGLTADGFEITLGTNHLGPHLFTRLLLPRLKESAQGRIVNVASRAHLRVQGFEWSDFTRATTSTKERLARYGQSKLMNVLHARELARRLAGTKVTTYALHPGVVATNVWREVPRPLQPLIKLFMISEEEGAKTTLYCATEPALASETGRYYDKQKPAKTNPRADDETLARELWERSDRFVDEALARG